MKTSRLLNIAIPMFPPNTISITMTRWPRSWREPHPRRSHFRPGYMAIRQKACTWWWSNRPAACWPERAQREWIGASIIFPGGRNCQQGLLLRIKGRDLLVTTWLHGWRRWMWTRRRLFRSTGKANRSSRTVPGVGGILPGTRQDIDQTVP